MTLSKANRDLQLGNTKGHFESPGSCTYASCVVPMVEARIFPTDFIVIVFEVVSCLYKLVCPQN